MKQKLLLLSAYMRETDVVNFTALRNNYRHREHSEAAGYCLHHESDQTVPYISDENYIASKIKFVEDLANLL